MHQQIERSLQTVLMQLQQLLTQLSDDEYAQPLEVLSGSSIGEHARHIIEFFQTLGNSYQTGVVNYDARKRNKLLERSCQLAQQELTFISQSLFKEDKKMLLVGCYSNDSEEPTTVESTYYRELVYNLEHAVHHMAMIKIAIRKTGVEIPGDFGVAVATVKHKKLAHKE